MKRFILISAALFLATFPLELSPSFGGKAAEPKAKLSAAGKVYGEWRIRVRPDKLVEYNQLIQDKGLPLFRAAGGRMVGWWNTLIGDLYEHVTIWEYDDMAAFEKAVHFLGNNEKFAQFVAARDPLLSGEESRFLKLATVAEKPGLPENAAFVIHEIHKVPLRGTEAYLHFMEKEGLSVLKKHGFRPAGPWLVAVGKWNEITYLFRFKSLSEREKLIAQFMAHAEGKSYSGKVSQLADEITTRLLIPAPFARARELSPKQSSADPFPHSEQIAPGVFVAGFADRYEDANCGWIKLRDETLLVDLPHGIPIAVFLAYVGQTTKRPARTLVLAHIQAGDIPVVESLLAQGLTRIVTSPAIRKTLLAGSKKISAGQVQAFAGKTSIGDHVDFFPLDDFSEQGGAALSLPERKILFAGPLVVNGPRAKLHGKNTARWISALREMEQLGAIQVIPGFGSWGSGDMLSRQRRFLFELRRQIAHLIAQGRPLSALATEVRIPADDLVWLPYGNPTLEDMEQVYREMTVPLAPFNKWRGQGEWNSRPHALVLIGDGPHEPGRLEEGLQPVFEATGIVPHFTVDVRALTADNLARVSLLVIFRDGLQRPDNKATSHYAWMTPEQERAVVQFVQGGGGFLNLHNSLALYPADGPYLAMLGGRYIGHGPLERFRVEVVDAGHPVTRGVQAFSVADEQHTPIPDKAKVHLLLQNRSDEGKVAAAGWVREVGKGRLCHLANGHTSEALLHPMFQLLLRNAAHWCLHRQDPEIRAQESGNKTRQP